MDHTPSTRRKRKPRRDDVYDYEGQPRPAKKSTNNCSGKTFTCPGCNERVLAKDKKDFMKKHSQMNNDCMKALFHCPNLNCPTSYFGLTLNDLRFHAAYLDKCNDALDDKMHNLNRIQNYETTGTPFALENSAEPVSRSFWPTTLRGRGSTKVLEAGPASSTSFHHMSIPSHADQSGFAHHHNLVGVSTGAVKRNLEQVIFQGSSSNREPIEEIIMEQVSQDNMSIPDNENDSVVFSVDSGYSVDSNNQDIPEENAASVDKNKLLAMDKILVQNIKEASFDASYVCFLELETILRKAHVPNNVFDKVMRWSLHNSDVLSHRSDLFTRKKLYQDSSKFLYGSLDDEMRPKQNTIRLPSGRLVAITTFDIVSQIYSLLECPFLNKGGLDNTIFQYGDESNPFRLPVDATPGSFYDNTYFDDVETCLWYIKTYLGLDLQHLPHEILVPIIAFLDSTVLNGQSSHNIEPFMFTLGIFKRMLRNHPKAWRSLGFLEDLFRIIGTSSMSAEEKMEDYHFILDHIMKGLKELTSSDGLLWTFETKDKKLHTVKLHFRLMMIIGDTKGADVWVGRYGSHMNTSGLCRDCNMLTENSDNPHHLCKFNRFHEIDKLDEQGLELLSMRRVKHNAFRVPEWLFGASPYGVCVACPPEPLHVFLLGTVIRVYQYLTDQFTKLQADTFKRELTIVCNQDMGQRGKQLFPSMAKFSSGNYGMGNLTGNQKYARVFAMYLTLLKTDVKCFFIGKKGKVPSRVKKPPKKKKPTKKKAAKTKRGSTRNPIVAEVDLENIDENDDNNDNSVVDQEDESQLFTTEQDENVLSDSDDERLHQNDPSDDNCDNNNVRRRAEGMTPDVDINPAPTRPDVDVPNAPISAAIHPKAPALFFTIEVYNDLVFILEECLTFYQWLVSAKHQKSAFKGGRDSPVAKRCRQFMDDYKRIAPRLEGMGLKLVKYHHLNHWYFYIQMYGSPLNSDGGPLESSHKENAKDVGKRTQQRTETLTFQTGTRTYEKTLEDRCAMQCNLWEIPQIDFDNEIVSDDNVDVAPSPAVVDELEELDLADNMDSLFISNKLTINSNIQGPYFRLDFEYRDCDPSIKSDSMTITWLERRDGRARKIQLPSFDSQTMSAVHQKLRYYNCGKSGRRIVSILGGTGLSADNGNETVIRATPSYRSGQQWFDYITYDWSGDEGKLPAKVKIILDYSTMTFDDITEQVPLCLSPILRENHPAIDGIKIMIHSAKTTNNIRDIKSKVGIWYEMESQFQMVSPTHICDISFCLPDTFSTEGNLTSLLCVIPKSDWSSSFFNYSLNEMEHEDLSEDMDSCYDELDSISFTDIE